MKINKEIELGDEVVHEITGVKGIATSVTTYISGCDRISITQKVKKDCSMPDLLAFDRPEIKVIKKKKIKRNNNKIGGYKPDVNHYLKG